ncbi:RNA-directed DNA polymerase, eukaryota, reverse transcriptase zinc-binding domain protein [Tanacetum coccineum]
MGIVNAFSIDEFFSSLGNVNVPVAFTHIWQAVVWTTGYFIWKERNARVFGNKVTITNKIVQDIQLKSFEWIVRRSNKFKEIDWQQWMYDPLRCRPQQPITILFKTCCEPNAPLVSKGSKKWELTVYGQFVGCYMAESALRYHVRRMWSKYGFIDVQDPTIGLEKKDETKIPLWAKIKNIPLEAWTKDRISALASSLGKPLRMDNIIAQVCQTGRGRADFARVLVEFDVTKGFKKEICIQYMSKENIVKGTKVVNVEYQWRPEIYSHCMVNENNGSNKEDKGFIEEAKGSRSKTIQDDILSPILKSNNKYVVLEEEETDERTKLKSLKYRMLVDQYLNKKMQPTCVEAQNWSKDMISYFKLKWEEDRMKEMESQQENIEDVISAANVVSDNPWIMLGDFSVTMKSDEHSAGGSQLTGDMQDLIDCANDIEMEDINSTCLFYTWIKSPSKPKTSIMKKLDRIMVNGSFMSTFAEAYGQFLPFITLDHSVALLIMPRGLIKKRRSFRFTNYIVDKEDFLPTVEKEWNQDIRRYNMYRVVKKLKAIKQPMRKLNWKNGNLTEKVEVYREKLKASQRDMTANPHNERLKTFEAECLAEYVGVCKQEEHKQNYEHL